ncbi:hypothetical protein N7478_011382 [Penicillium angulare]|uniref:uncharacterized protein n=1 Tax=Penicillium angulare TaxID=116970 RepID=UPI0025423B51|nr:uncharacterized protein N7478_011382 [Penicillium angulare]KAJ5263777.1 hypothetical protein N7478_011382 [Penicillium angulare]
MSIDSSTTPGQEKVPGSSIQNSTSPPPPNANTKSTPKNESTQDHDFKTTESASTTTLNSTSTSNLISSILSPFSSLLSSQTPPSEDKTKEKEKEQKPKEDGNENENENETTSPTPYFTPNQVPKFKALQKKRLSGTRTKQLLKAAGRAFDDPPPPPELGTCCGSSCDPCVNDLWREEREVWRERWGDRRVEADGGVRRDLEW